MDEWDSWVAKERNKLNNIEWEIRWFYGNLIWKLEKSIPKNIFRFLKKYLRVFKVKFLVISKF
jgi:hypothetical protein